MSRGQWSTRHQGSGWPASLGKARWASTPGSGFERVTEEEHGLFAVAGAGGVVELEVAFDGGEGAH